MSGAALRDTGIPGMSLRRGKMEAESGPATRQRPGPWPNPTRGSDMAHRTCSIETCTNRRMYAASGFCGSHEYRRRRGIPLEVPLWGLDKTGSRGTPEERFWRKVDKRGPDECWEWTAGTSGAYGRFALDGRNPINAQVASWILHNGPVPKGMEVCHACDNPPCVNPAHLFLGTQADNMRDMWAKGRGNNPPPSVLSDPNQRTCPICGGWKAWASKRCAACRRATGYMPGGADPARTTCSFCGGTRHHAASRCHDCRVAAGMQGYL